MDAEAIKTAFFQACARLNHIAAQIRPMFEKQIILNAAGRDHFDAWTPTVSEQLRHVLTPQDYLPSARSVLVFALRMHNEVLLQAGKPPAEAVGPYAFQTYATTWVGATIAVRLIKELEQRGYRAAMSMDLLNTASLTANPRGGQPDSFSNRFAAVAAGMGWLTRNGRTASPQFGLRQRFIAVVTDAPLDESPLRHPDATQDLCATCAGMCIGACPSNALKAETATLSVEGGTYRFGLVDNLLCDWTKRYALMADSGFKYLGSETDIDPRGTVTEEKLSAALPQLDPIKNIRPAVLEPCLAACPYATG